MKLSHTLAAAAAILTLTGATAMAAPCAVGKTTNSQGQNASGDKSSNTDQTTKNLAGGEHAGAPKTVGAMNNVGAAEKPGPGEKKPPEGKVIQGQNSNDC
ncbi:hypothetical protein [Methylorubrum extorquens]